ncbi:MAG: hypothetical protein QNJ98_11640 [Planctomycetota bacterium]|nr:hypothetical protein [Planctomycetota bacterium]
MCRQLWIAAVLVLFAPLAFAEEAAKAGDTIAWEADLASAFAKAKELNRPLMICVNAKFVAGRETEEPAAKGLREHIYVDARVVTKSRQFVCALLTRAGSSADYGELRALGISGRIVSPQHIFVHPDGTRILERQQYWSHGRGESGIKALLALMDVALAQMNAPAEPESPDAPETPDEPEAPSLPVEAPPEAGAGEDAAAVRAAWIQRMVTKVDKGAAEERQMALRSLVKHDREGDCTDPLIEMIPKSKKRVPVLVDLIRALGVPGLDKAAGPIGKQLKHKEEVVRGNAAVTLEYIGSKSSVSTLMKVVGKEDNESIANHMYRALGRCGVGNAKARALLLKRSMAGRSTFATYGPVIGLAYFEKDKKAARGVEKEFKKVGHPFGGRRSGRNSFKRALFMWCLSEIEDPKSGPWIREERIEPLENAESRWKDLVIGFYVAAARKCEGEEDEAIETTIREAMERYLGWRNDRTPLKDEYRIDRDMSKFTPKMEFDPRDDDDS